MAFNIVCRAIGVWMLLACSIGLVVVSFVYIDVSTLSNTRKVLSSLVSSPLSSSSEGGDNDIAELEPAKDLRNETVGSGTLTADSPETVGSSRSVSGCDISQGKWVYDETYPLYESTNCPFMDGGFRCGENGRPDSNFTKFRWQPRDCDLPRFDAVAMLERLRDQRVAFVGDSLGRNQWESMLCMLAEGVANKSRIYETNGEPITKHTGHLVFRFQDYNLTVEYYREPFLVPQTRSPPNSPTNVTTVLVLDQLAWTVKYWSTANILVFNTGHWWLWERTLGGGGGFQIGKNVTNHSLMEGFQIAMNTWASWTEDNINPNTTQAFFRSYSPRHFVGGDWDSGGRCDGEPLGEVAPDEETRPWTNKYIVDAIKQKVRSKRGSVEFLNITASTSYRADGHPGTYNDAKQPGSQDCSHFCLPGVPDSWNELLFASLLAKGQPPFMH